MTRSVKLPEDPTLAQIADYLSLISRTIEDVRTLATRKGRQRVSGDLRRAAEALAEDAKPVVRAPSLADIQPVNHGSLDRGAPAQITDKKKPPRRAAVVTGSIRDSSVRVIKNV